MEQLEIQLRNITEEYQFLEQQSSLQVDTLLESQRISNQLVSQLLNFINISISGQSPTQNWFQNIHILVQNLNSQVKQVEQDSRIEEINQLRQQCVNNLQTIMAQQEPLTKIHQIQTSKDINQLIKACDQLKLALNESTERVYQLTSQNKELLSQNFTLKDKLNHIQSKVSHDLSKAREDILRQQKIIEEIVHLTDNFQQ